MSGGFSGHTHTDETRRKIAEVSQRPENIEKLHLNRARWLEQNPDEAHAAFARGAFKVAHFVRSCHDTKLNPRCPFCSPEDQAHD
jgi:hypothetical protein